MTNERHDEKRVLKHESAPEHMPGFWDQVSAGLRFDTSEEPPLPQATSGAQMVSSLHGAGPLGQTAPNRAIPGSTIVLAVAAALVLFGGIMGISALANNQDDTIEVVTEMPEQRSPGSVALDGPARGDDEAGNGSENGADSNSASGREADDLTGVSGASSDGPEPQRNTIIAPGNTATVMYPAKDNSLGQSPIFLETWEQMKLSWFALVSAELDCTAKDYAEIRYVNEAGISLPVSQPQRWFSGKTSHLSVQSLTNPSQAAWLVSCDDRVELWHAILASNGEFHAIDLIWIGSGDAEPALLLWESGVLSVNMISGAGEPGYLDYDSDTQTLSGTLPIPPLDQEQGAPAEIESILVGATSAAGATATPGFTYWNAANPRQDSDCSGSPRSLWLRDQDRRWTPALVDDLEMSDVVAFAVEPETSQVAFSDACAGNGGRVMLATVRADGLFSSVKIFDLSPYGPGTVSELVWTDPMTLYVVTDNSHLDIEPYRFELSFEQGRDDPILTRLGP